VSHHNNLGVLRHDCSLNDQRWCVASSAASASVTKVRHSASLSRYQRWCGISPGAITSVTRARHSASLSRASAGVGPHAVR